MFNLTAEQYAELRRQILEEAAKVCETQRTRDSDQGVQEGIDWCRDAIRELAGKTKED